MRVISCHPGYTLQIFEGQDIRETDPVTGQSYTHTVRQALNAQFMAGAEGAGIYPHELTLALEKWDNFFRGKPDEVYTNPAPYISVYDTEAQKILLGWTDEYHQKVVERIRFLAPDRADRMLVIEDVPASKPFQKYDEKTPEDILAFMEWSGGDPALYIAYEEENQARPALLEAFQFAKDNENSAREGEVIASVTA